MDIDISKLIFQFVAALIGLIIDRLNNSNHKQAARVIIVCDNILLEQINAHFGKLSLKLGEEFNKLLSINAESLSFQQLGTLGPNINFALNRNDLKKIEELQYLKIKFNLFLSSIQVLRWIFYILLVFGVIYVILSLANPQFLPEWYLYSIITISIISLCILIFIELKLQNSITKFMCLYGIEI